jgi:curved DNA-binding protein CbpA
MMETSNFIDYYEILEISPNANSGTIERMFRYFAHRYHPDNKDTGDRVRFGVVLEARAELGDPAKRAKYDVQYKIHSDLHWNLAEKASNSNGIERDSDIQNKVLALLYARRRQDITDPGVGNLQLERLLGCPAEHLDFHFWYLKAKGWIAKTECGTLAITADGVDRVNIEHHAHAAKKLLTDQRYSA